MARTKLGDMLVREPDLPAEADQEPGERSPESAEPASPEGAALSSVTELRPSPAPASGPESESTPESEPELTDAPDSESTPASELELADAPEESPPADTRKKSKRRKGARSTTEKTPAPAPRPLPRYLQLERKEVRIREDQLETLTVLSRRLNKRRQGHGERITENTLIRVAIDLLLDNEKDLLGTTENELRRSAGL